MAITTPIDQATSPTEPTAPTAPRVRRRAKSRMTAQVAAVMIVVGVFAGLLAPYDPLAVDFGAMLAKPNAAHWLGTDAFGRDVLSRLIYGSRTALLVGFGAAVFGATV